MAKKTKQEAQETRTSLIDAAEQLFQQRGVSRCSLQDIAQAAGLTRGAIYWHFKDKTELFKAMMERATMPLEEGMAAPEAALQLSLAELRWGWINVLHSTVNNERTRRVFDIAIHRVEYSGEMQGLQERKLTSLRAWRQQNQAAFAHAVSLGQLPACLNIAAAAVALVARHGHMGPAGLTLSLAAATAIFAAAGALLSSRIPAWLLSGAFGVLMVVVAVTTAVKVVSG